MGGWKVGLACSLWSHLGVRSRRIGAENHLANCRLTLKRPCVEMEVAVAVIHRDEESGGETRSHGTRDGVEAVGGFGLAVEDRDLLERLPVEDVIITGGCQLVGDDYVLAGDGDALTIGLKARLGERGELAVGVFGVR